MSDKIYREIATGYTFMPSKEVPGHFILKPYVDGVFIQCTMESKNEPVEIPDWCCWNKKFKK